MMMRALVIDMIGTVSIVSSSRLRIYSPFLREGIELLGINPIDGFELKKFKLASTPLKTEHKASNSMNISEV